MLPAALGLDSSEDLCEAPACPTSMQWLPAPCSVLQPHCPHCCSYCRALPLEALCDALNCGPPGTYIEIMTPVALNVASFANRVIADVMSYNGVRLESSGPMTHSNWCPCKKEKLGHTLAWEGRSMKVKVRGLHLQTKEHRSLPASLWMLGGGLGQALPRAFRQNQPCLQLDLGLLARTVFQWISIV